MFPSLPQKLDITPDENQEIISFITRLFDAARILRRETSKLFHYTDPAGFKAIIESGCLRATHLSYTNDAREYDHALGLLKEEVEKKKSGASAIQQKLLSTIQSGITGTNLFNMFHFGITCFCAEADKLAQWKTYGRGEGGITIGFDFKGMGLGAQHTKSMLAPVIYKTDQQLEIVRKFLEWALETYPIHADKRPEGHRDQHVIDWWNIVSFHAAHVAPLFKNDGFEEENEWRLIHLFQHISDVQFATKGSHLSPYLELYVPAISHPPPFPPPSRGMKKKPAAAFTPARGVPPEPPPPRVRSVVLSRRRAPREAPP